MSTRQRYIRGAPTAGVAASLKPASYHVARSLLLEESVSGNNAHRSWIARITVIIGWLFLAVGLICLFKVPHWNAIEQEWRAEEILRNLAVFTDDRGLKLSHEETKILRNQGRHVTVTVGYMVGTSPFDVLLFDDETFTCADGSATMPVKRLNDDYCDCADGSDEPGTSACPNGLFYCSEKPLDDISAVSPKDGKRIYSSRVNDGYCDCCDGSDEYGNIGICQNTC